MKNFRFLIWTCTAFLFAAPAVQAQMFYNSGSGFDSTGSTFSRAERNDVKAPTNDDFNVEETPAYETIVSPEIRERIRADAAYIVGEPEETLCYGIARKSPKKRSATIDGYAHTGNCGSLNETGMEEVQQKLFSTVSYDMKISKIVSCVVTPKIALRFRRGFDIVDVILSGGNCPAVFFLYGGDTKEFSAKPIKEWLDGFIEAVSGDMENVTQEDLEKASVGMFKKREQVTETEPQPEQPAAPKMWGRRVIRPAEEAAE